MTPIRLAWVRWRGRPFPFERVRTFGDLVLDMVGLRKAIAGCTLAIVVASGLPLLSPSGPQAPASVAFVAGTLVAALLVARRWWLGPWPGHRKSLVFTLCADLAVGAGPMLYADPLHALPATCLLVVVGLYVTLVHSWRVVLAHAAWSAVVVTVLVVRVAMDSGDLALALSTWLALFCGLVGLPLILFAAWAAVRQAAWDSMSDQLTGLVNRRGLSAVVTRMRAPSHGHRTVVAVIDLDRFKAVNDEAGHAAGDEVLRRVAARLVAARHRIGLTARVGGEEMVTVTVVPPGGEAALGRLLLDLVHAPDDPHPVTASVGIAALEHLDGRYRLGDSLRRADEAMYAAKREGRARAVVAGDEPDGVAARAVGARQ